MRSPLGRTGTDDRQAGEQWPPSPLDTEYCDACHAPGQPHISRAYVLYQLPTGRLALCHHHANLYRKRLETLSAVVLIDDRERLYAPPPTASA